MKTWTNPEVEELEVKLTAGGCKTWFYESCITHGPSCDHGNNNNNPEENPDGDGTSGDVEIPDDGGKEEGTPS